MLVVRLQFGDPRSLFITERIRTMFDLNADWAAIVQSLRTDPMLAAQVESVQGSGWRAVGMALNSPRGQFLVNRSRSRARPLWLVES